MKQDLHTENDHTENDVVMHQSQLLSNVSHELRTHMNGVVGMADLLQETNLSSQQREYVRTLRSAGDSLLHIVNDILDLSKIGAGTMQLESHPFDLQQCIEGAIDLVTADALGKNTEVYYSLHPDVPRTVVGDMIRLRQIVVNLLSNAVKFTENGEVVVTINSEPLPNHRHQFHFAIRDTGIGIPPKKQASLFQPFSQIDPARSGNITGVGLGLVVCKQITELMEGTIWVESKEGQGTTFYFTIQAEVMDDSAYYHRNTDQYLRHGTALLIGNRATSRSILSDYLQRWGMKMHSANDVQEALTWIQNNQQIDIIIVDVGLTDSTGSKSEIQRFIEQFLKSTRIKSIPVIVLTPIYDHAKYLALGVNSKSLSETKVTNTLTNPRCDVGLTGVNSIFCLAKPLKMWMLHELLVQHFRGDAPVHQPTVDIEPHGAKNLSILLVEDNAVNQLVTLRILERLGYKADLARSGAEALQAVRHRPYELILMDIVLPDIDGVEVTRQLRAEPPNGTNPQIIAMTAAAMPAELERAMSAGMNGYITKPFHISQLKELFQQVEIQVIS